MNHDYVFVYGSLKRGFGNSGLLRNSKFMQDAVTHPSYTMVNLGFFPGVLLKGNTPITGELYSVTESDMKVLDRLEGYPSFYNRMRIPLPGLDVEPWMYYLPRKTYAQAPEVPDGMWLPLRS